MSLNFELIKPSASMEASKIANELKTKGQKVYPLSIGDTHFSPPACIKNKFLSLPPEYSHYSPSLGIQKLRSQIAQTIKGYEFSDVILVPGLKQGLYYILALLSGKTICILEPAWLGYQSTALASGCNTVAINMYNENWLSILNETKFDAIIICSPNNPDGKIFSQNEIDFILDVVKKNDAYLILDSIYDRFDYTRENKYCINDALTDYSRTIICNGFSKSFAMTGFRIGYILCKNSELIRKIDLIQQTLSTCVNTFSQYLLLDFENAKTEIDQYVNYYKENRDIVLDIFPEWDIFTPQGGFYFFVNLELYGITDATLFCNKILQSEGVALVTGAAYGTGFDSYVRVSFSVDRDLLIEALNILKTRIQNEKN